MLTGLNAFVLGSIPWFAGDMDAISDVQPGLALRPLRVEDEEQEVPTPASR